MVREEGAHHTFRCTPRAVQFSFWRHVTRGGSHPTPPPTHASMAPGSPTEQALLLDSAEKARSVLSQAIEPPMDLIHWISGFAEVHLFVAPFEPASKPGTPPGTTLLMWWYRRGRLEGMRWLHTRAAFPVLKLHKCAHVTLTVAAKLLGLALVDCTSCHVHLTSSTVGNVEILRCHRSTVDFHAPVGLCLLDSAHRVHLRLWEGDQSQDRPEGRLCVGGLISNSLDCTSFRGGSERGGATGRPRPLPYTYGSTVPFFV